jgi:phenylalanyl-tRNA synthetase beta subunit
MRTVGGSELDGIQVIDSYDDHASGVRAVTFDIHYQDEQGALSREDANARTEDLVRAVESAYGTAGVALRGSLGGSPGGSMGAAPNHQNGRH